jgi:ArsR family transcriptional regulator
MDVDDSTLHYHLKKLLDAHLIEKWKRTEKGQDGLSTFYRPTVYGEVVLTEGVDTLIRAEHEFEAMYDSSANGA